MNNREKGTTMNITTTIRLVICDDQSIHREGCKDSLKYGMNPGPFAEDFDGTTMREFAIWHVEDWNKNTNEDTTVEEWLGVLKDDCKPCTGLR
jgi:hypothetical protein